MLDLSACKDKKFSRAEWEEYFTKMLQGKRIAYGEEGVGYFRSISIWRHAKEKHWEVHLKYQNVHIDCTFWDFVHNTEILFTPNVNT